MPSSSAKLLQPASRLMDRHTDNADKPPMWRKSGGCAALRLPASMYSAHSRRFQFNAPGADRWYLYSFSGTMYKRKQRSEEHTSELPSLMRTSYAVFCLKKKNKNKTQTD